MGNAPLDTDLFDRAARFALQAHAGTERRGKEFPYIIHPMEAAAIVASETSDPELLAAAMLHDVVEDTDTTLEEIRAAFGNRIAALVAAESDVEMPLLPPSESWHARKQAAIDRLAAAPREAKIVALGDKLSNMRAIARDYALRGDAIWDLFHVKDRTAHEWHYRGLAGALADLADTYAYREFVRLIDEVFPRQEEEIKPVRIDLRDYERAGEGSNGASFNHRTDPDILLKLYFKGKERQAVDELRVARNVYAAGIPTPEPGDLVTDGTLTGIRFRRIRDKVSFASAVGNHPARAAGLAGAFAALCKRLHETHVDTSLFENVKDRYLRLLAANPSFDAAQKRKIADFIHAAPDADTAIHGDLQFGNALIAGENRWLIDLGDFCYGYPMFDLGMVYLTCKLNEERYTLEAYHMDNATASAFWDAFAPAYFGPDADLAAVEAEVRIYAGLKTLIVERDTRRPMPEFRAMLEGTIY